MANMILQKENQQEYSKKNNPQKNLVRLAKFLGRITAKKGLLKKNRNYHSLTNNPNMV
jgi:hypothetical protein